MPGNPLRELKKRSPSRCPSRRRDRKSTRLNSSHSQISYAVFCLKKKKQKNIHLLEYIDILLYSLMSNDRHITSYILSKFDDCNQSICVCNSIIVTCTTSLSTTII